MERDDKLKMQNNLIKKISNEIKIKGKSIDLNNEESVNEFIDNLTEKIMKILM